MGSWGRGGSRTSNKSRRSGIRRNMVSRESLCMPPPGCPRSLAWLARRSVQQWGEPSWALAA